MNILGAIVAGIAGTLVFTMVMGMAPRMGVPKMDIVEMLGSMFSWPPNKRMGWMMHLVNGSIFAIIYAALWNAKFLGGYSILGGVIYGALHWLITGLMFGGMPMLHKGIKDGNIDAPGIYMTAGGAMGFVGGLVVHIVFGVVVALVYGLFPVR